MRQWKKGDMVRIVNGGIAEVKEVDVQQLGEYRPIMRVKHHRGSNPAFIHYMDTGECRNLPHYNLFVMQPEEQAVIDVLVEVEHEAF